MRLLAAAVCTVAALALAAPAFAHVSGKAEPRIAAEVTGGSGLDRDVIVRLTDLDSGEPVTGATVTATASMSDPHAMQLAPWELSERSPGVYGARVRFVMAAHWTLGIQVSGPEVVGASSNLAVDIAPGAALAPASGGPAPLPTRLNTSVTDRDVLSIVVLWLHAISASAWILGVLLMAIALSTPLAAAGVRARLGAWYRRRGAWWHWGLVGVVIGTGIYNMLDVTPFRLGFSAAGLDRIALIPYGRLYEAILIVKLGLFAALLVTGTQLLVRTIHPPTLTASEPVGFWRTLGRGLGPSGVVYLCIVPLVLGAAAALRYVHILSHVAEVVASG
jgi:hypothetical protein